MAQYPNGFYAYLWLREDGTPYYVGKGSGNRGFEKSGHLVNPPKDKSKIVILPRKSEEDALATEIELIHNWGRKDIGTGCLRNRTSGGERCYIRNAWTQERRDAQAKRIKKQGLGGWNKGLKMPELSEKMRGKSTNKGYKHTEETKQKLREANTGRVRTPEQLKTLSESHKGTGLGNQNAKGYKLTFEQRRHLSENRKGQGKGNRNAAGCTRSPETRAKMSLNKFLKTVAWG